MQRYQIVMLGRDTDGMKRLYDEFFSYHCPWFHRYDPTLEDVKVQLVVDEKPCMLDVLITSGDMNYPALRELWMRESDGFIITHTAAVQEGLETAALYYDEINAVLAREKAGFYSPGDSPYGGPRKVKQRDGMPIILVGDTSYSRSTTENDTVEELARDLGIPFVATCWQSKLNVSEPFIVLVREIRRLQHEQELRLAETSNHIKGSKGFGLWGATGEGSDKPRRPKSVVQLLKTVFAGRIKAPKSS